VEKEKKRELAMSEPARGFWFVPIPLDTPTWKTQLIERIFNHFGIAPEIENTGIKLTYHHLYPSRSLTPDMGREQMIGMMAVHEPGWSIVRSNFGGFGAYITCYHTQPQSAYQIFDIDVDKHAFSDIQGDPMKVEAFSAEWVRMCEVLGAEVAYFSEATYSSPDELSNEGLTFLQQENLQGFVNYGWWRTYLYPRTIENWQEKLDLSQEEQVEHLPSGALLIANGNGYNPQIGDFDALPNARFLLTQVEKRAEIPGADQLLSIVRHEEKHLARIYDDQDYAKHHDEAFYDWEGLAQARVVLDEVRATWACALERPGLVGVQQAFAEVIVPVVADGGREWILPTLLFPVDKAQIVKKDERRRQRLAKREAAWSDIETGLLGRVLWMQERAKGILVDGESPRIVVYCWRGVSPDVQGELQSLGVQVEVADHLPLLE
jgi:hypothetical protein